MTYQSHTIAAAKKKAEIPTLAQAKKMPEKELFDLYNRGAMATSFGVRCMAVAYVALREKGIDVSVFQHGLIKYFDRVVAGKIIPQILVEYAGSPQHIEQMVRLVPEEQEKMLGSAARVRVARLGSDGELETREKAPAACSIREMALVVGEGRLRTPDEQRHFLAPAAASRQVVAPAPASDDVDVWRILTVAQQNRVVAQASRFNVSVAQYLRNMLIQNNVIVGKLSGS